MVEFFTTRRGSRLRCVTGGSGPALMAVHGLGGGAYFFEGLARRLASRASVTAIDLPGTGGSSAAGGPSLDGWVDDLSDLAATRLGAPVVIVGHSLGTILALEIWRARPELVRAMVFVGGLPAARPLIRERLTARAASIRADGIRGWGERAALGVFSPRTLREAPETAALFARLFDDQEEATYLACLDILLAADARDVVATVTVPCASISGADDQYAPPADVAAFVAGLPPGTESVVLPGVGHLPFFESPEALAEAVDRFVGAL